MLYINYQILWYVGWAQVTSNFTIQLMFAVCVVVFLLICLFHKNPAKAHFSKTDNLHTGSGSEDIYLRPGMSWAFDIHINYRDWKYHFLNICWCTHFHQPTRIPNSYYCTSVTKTVTWVPWALRRRRRRKTSLGGKKKIKQEKKGPLARSLAPEGPLDF